MLKRLWTWLRTPRGAVRCDVCGRWAYPLKWGGLMHISEMGTCSVHAIHYIRHMFDREVVRSVPARKRPN